MAKNMTDRKKNVSRSQAQATEVRALDSVQTTDKAVKASARDERREPAKSSSKVAARRETKPSIFARVRKTKVGRFIYDSYYELRYKVTWPTFLEARNMTIAVVLLCAVLGAILSLVDFGLYRLVVLIIGGK
ncbi:preprotein translocase subunit SecE [Ktedonobacteria bacterium brp13]|nr:preprotein translocase subunit SecE [Ktedonobacteria bacterium brp13]